MENESVTSPLLQIPSLSALALTDHRKGGHAKVRDKKTKLQRAASTLPPRAVSCLAGGEIPPKPLELPGFHSLSGTCVYRTSSSLTLALVLALFLKKHLAKVKPWM